MDRIGKTSQAIHRSNEDIRHATILQIGDHREPEIGPFPAISDPVSENITFAL